MGEQIQEQQIQDVQEEMDHRDGDTDLDTSVTRSGRDRIPKDTEGRCGVSNKKSG